MDSPHTNRHDRQGRSGATVLFAGHPGHELRVFRWMELTRPSVAVVTDGSGSAAVSRLASTARVLASSGATGLDRCLGFCSDRRAYEAVLARDAAFFWSMTDRMLDSLAGTSVELVASDALEHFNPTHDVCCLLAAVLAARLSKAQAENVAHVCFPLDAHPSAGAPRAVIDVRLEPDALERKLSAAWQYPELRDEVEAALRAFGRQSFARECLWDADDPFAALERFDGVAHYERIGRERQAAGTYTDVITLDGHLRPIARALRNRCGVWDAGPAVTAVPARRGTTSSHR